MTVLRYARVTAVALSVGTFAFTFVGDNWRRDNLFLVPDLIVCVLLIIAALLPASRAVPALLIAFGCAAGVLGTAVSSYIVEGQLGIGSAVGTISAIVMAVLLARSQERARS